jgi:large subunit ribosomal protein L23
MAIFKKETKEEKKEVAEKTVKAKTPAEKKPFHVRKRKGRRQTTKSLYSTSLEKVLLRPRITEKATDVTSKGIYVFEVAVDATKKDVEKAVTKYYKVTPRKVNLVKILPKKRTNRRTRQVGLSAKGKKAYVFLKKGDTIEFV